MATDVEGWIQRRLNRPGTPALAEIIGALSDAGFGWLETTNYHLEFIRSISNDVWEEVTVWIGVTKTGLVRFKGARHAILTVDARTRRIDDVLAWAVKRASEE